MFRTDKYMNKMNGLIVFLVICVLIAIWPQDKKEEFINQEVYDPDVSDEEIDLALKNGISFNDTDQFGISTYQSWLPIQKELAQLNLALEYFSRLNLEKILTKHDELENEVERCISLQLNQNFEIFIQQFNTNKNNDTEIEDYLNKLQEQKANQSEWQIVIQNRIEVLTNEERNLKLQQTEYFVDEKAAEQIDNRKQNLKLTEKTILILRKQADDLEKKINALKDQGDEDEDLTQYYQKDQEQAKILRSLFKPTEAEAKTVKISNEDLSQFVKEFDSSIKQLDKPTDVYFNGLNFSPEIKKNQLLEYQNDLHKVQQKIDSYLLKQNDQQKDIEAKMKQKEQNDSNFKNVVARLEEIRNEKGVLKKQMDECQKQLKSLVMEIKKIIPTHKEQTQEKLSIQKQFKDYLYLYLQEDQNCFEKCIEYKSLKKNLQEGQYEQSLYAIQKHFSELDKLFREFKI